MLTSDTSAGKLPEMDVKLSARVVKCRSRQGLVASVYVLGNLWFDNDGTGIVRRWRL